jgi:hypothetical protein
MRLACHFNEISSHVTLSVNTAFFEDKPCLLFMPIFVLVYRQ